MREWPPLKWPAEPIRPAEPPKRAILQVRFLVVIGLVSLAAFFVWLLQPERRGDGWLFWPLFFALVYRALFWLFEWANYVRPKFEQFVAPKRPWTVDVLTTACPGEPRGMVLRTLRAMKAIRYPHRDFLCDEGDDPILREACRVLGIVHVTRANKRDAKAGNINHALTYASGEITVVLDPDHEPAPYLLDRVLGQFEDPRIGFVQSVQAYRNQSDSFVADGAAKQTYLFYGPIMIGMNAYGTTQAIGANCVFRRAALDSIGGHATGLAEDMHTTICLYGKGWRSVYVPEVLTRGLVPSTLSAYCKQQLKWAYGSFELLLHHLPRHFRRLTGWQRLHYVFAPLYFLRGFFGLISITVPIACLTLGGVALRIDLVRYLAMLAPALVVSAVLRQMTQRWAIEERERGAHLIGGLLGTGCWWVFLRGVVCAIFRTKLPYIPTPKDDRPEDSWGLAAPNLITSAVSIAAVIYGLATDWTPYSIFMAAFALWNAAQLTFVACLGLQRTMNRFVRWCTEDRWLGGIFSGFETARFALHGLIIRLMRERALGVAVPAFCVAALVHSWPRSDPPADVPEFKETGGFYVGAEFPEAKTGVFPGTFSESETRFGTRFRLFPFHQRWGPESLRKFPVAAMREARLHNAVPVITWEPWASSFTELEDDPELGRDRRICAAIVQGTFDGYLARYAEKVRAFGDPILIRFAPQPDNPAFPWSQSGDNTPEEFVEAWIYVVSFFQKAGAANVGWVWNPSSPATMDAYFPGVAFVDWIGLSALNHGQMGGNVWREFSELYAPFRPKVIASKLPVMLTEFGSTEIGGSRAAWLGGALARIASDYPEIRGLVFSGKSSGWFANDSPETVAAIAQGLRQKTLRPPERLAAAPPATLWRERPRETYRTKSISGEAGEFELRVDGQPFYIRGVAYNPAHDWRDGNMPLTRRELRKDFRDIRALGANTIRRYGRGWYDRNILRAAGEHDLRVLYGFWFDQDLDYLTDTRKQAEYRAQVEATVRRLRDDPNILAWSLGNEVWGLLKHHYAQPYLTEVRHAHVDFVEGLARRIHEIDSRHPVFVAHEHSPQLAGAFVDFAQGAPSLDFTGVNSYYEPRMAELREIATRFDPARPYLVSEFGPAGYWDERFARRDSSGALVEPGSAEKARDYVRGWSAHTLAHRGANIGGVAYCWRDRLEATATWFGLTDTQSRRKPAFLSLQQLWTGRQEARPLRITTFDGPAGVLPPGATIEVRAQVERPGPGVEYRWQLATEQFEFEVGRVRASANGTAAQVTLPKKPGRYRLYLNVSDGRAGDAANFPISVGIQAPAAPIADYHGRAIRVVAHPR